MFCVLPELTLPDLSVRTKIADQILGCLLASIPGSTACLRGSLAGGTSDAYSDIDILWEVEDALFPFATENVRDSLSQVRTIQSFRIDPEFRDSSMYRLLFVRFEGLPLFWRVDLEIFARSAGRNTDGETRMSSLPSDWSLAESALANSIAAIKACKRGKPDQAQELLERAFVRLGLEFTAANARDAIMQLSDRAKAVEPNLEHLADGIKQLVSS